MISKSPWKIFLGGGASTESPHYQRVHYCELLVRDFLMRLRGRRFPPIEKDMKSLSAQVLKKTGDTDQKVIDIMGRVELIETQLEEDDQSDDNNFEANLKRSMNRKRTINDNRLSS